LAGKSKTPDVWFAYTVAHGPRRKTVAASNSPALNRSQTVMVGGQLDIVLYPANDSQRCILDNK
jgi:hypothetical protein